MTLEVTAPGKLVLLGEYAVLFGAPAAVLAVGRRARVVIEEAEDERWTITSPGLCDEAIHLQIEKGGGLRWSDPERAGTSFGLVENLFNELTSEGMIRPTDLRPFAAILDTTSFFKRRDGERRKLGLGSSAALTTALANALVAWSGDACSRQSAQWLATLVEIHRRMQGGRGSGIDVAASLFGGVLRFQLGSGGGIEEAEPLELPKDLHITPIWTGRSASTSRFLERLDLYRKKNDAGVEAALDRLGDLSEQGVGELGRGQSTGFLEVVDAFTDALEALGLAIDLPILSAEHSLLKKLAREYGVHYKPSGAGGGDFGLAFSVGEQPPSAFGDRVLAEGFDVMSLEIDPVGLAVQRC